MEAEVIYVASYTCPHCGTALEVRQRDWTGWMRCPACTRPSLPPEVLSSTSSRRAEVSIDYGDSPIFMPLQKLDKTLEFRLDSIEPKREHGTQRLIFSTALAFSLILFVLYAIDRDGIRMAIFAGFTVVSLLLWLRVRQPKTTGID